MDDMDEMELLEGFNEMQLEDLDETEDEDLDEMQDQDLDEMQDQDLGEMQDQDLGEMEIPITLETVAWFTAECITYVLRWHNLEWSPPVSTHDLRMYSELNLFTVEIGKALAHHCMVRQSQAVADLTGFNIEEWLQMAVDEARKYVREHLLNYTFVLPIGDQFKHLFLLTFACYLCRQAVIRNQTIFVSDVFIELLNIMHLNYKYKSHYELFKTKATSYNLLHFQYHSMFGEERFLSNLSDLSDLSDLSGLSDDSDL